MKKYNILFISLFIALFCLTFISADASYYLKSKQSNNLVVPVLDENNNQVNSSTLCYFSMVDSNQVQQINNGLMDFYIGGKYNYTINDSQDANSGTYSGSIYCSDNITSGFSTFSMEVNPTGQKFEITQAYLFVGLLALFILFLIGGVIGLSRAINGAWQITYICLSYLSLFCIFFTSWLYSSNYLWQTPILASIFWILWLVLAVGFLPFILIIGTYIVGKGITDNLFKQYKAEGYSDEEAKDMAKRRRR